MTIAELTSAIAKTEGKKVQCSIGNVREIISILSDMIYADSISGEINRMLYKNGQRRHYARKQRIIKAGPRHY